MTITQDSEDEGRRLLALATDDAPPGLDLLAGFQARRGPRPGRWSRPRLRILVAAGTLAAAVIAAITLTARPVRAPSLSAPAELARAAVITAAQNYRIATRVTSIKPAAGIPAIIISGAFNPARGIGEESFGDAGGADAVRYDGRFAYLRLYPETRKLDERDFHWDIRPGQSWIREALPKPDLSPAGLNFALQASSEQTVQLLSPRGLVALLKVASHVRATGPVSGLGWTGTRYSFQLGETMTPGSKTSLTLTTRGTVDVDRRDRIRSLAAIETYYSPGAPRGYRTIVKSITITFSGFGQPVPVSIPPASQVFVPPRH